MISENFHAVKVILNIHAFKLSRREINRVKFSRHEIEGSRHEILSAAAAFRSRKK